jgi:hypothetical protein
MTNSYRYASLSFSLLLAAVVIMQPGPARAMTVQGVTFAESIREDNTVLRLHNAALLRYLKVCLWWAGSECRVPGIQAPHQRLLAVAAEALSRRYHIMLKLLKVYLLSIPLFLLLNYLWLGKIMAGFYREGLGTLARRSGDAIAPLPWATVLVYLLIPLGIVLFALPRTSAESPLLSGLLWGILYWGGSILDADGGSFFNAD